MPATACEGAVKSASSIDNGDKVRKRNLHPLLEMKVLSRKAGEACQPCARRQKRDTAYILSTAGRFPSALTLAAAPFGQSSSTAKVGCEVWRAMSASFKQLVCVGTITVPAQPTSIAIEPTTLIVASSCTESALPHVKERKRSVARPSRDETMGLRDPYPVK